jgi:ABC-type enterochelin transport system substrate-binding protein
MNEQAKEFLKQINREIKKYETYIESAKKELLKSMENKNVISDFGLSRIAETVTKYQYAMESLINQKDNFLAIFDITE